MGNSSGTLTDTINKSSVEDLKTVCSQEKCEAWCNQVIGKCLLRPTEVKEYIDYLLKNDYNKVERQMNIKVNTTNRDKASQLVETMIQQALPVVMIMFPFTPTKDSFLLCHRLTANQALRAYNKTANSSNIFDAKGNKQYEQGQTLIVYDKVYTDEGVLYVEVSVKYKKNKDWVQVKDNNVTFSSNLECLESRISDLLTLSKASGSGDTLLKVRSYLRKLRTSIVDYETIFFKKLESTENNKWLDQFSSLENIKRKVASYATDANIKLIKSTVVSLIFYYAFLNIIIPYFAFGAGVSVFGSAVGAVKCIQTLEQTLFTDITSFAFDYDYMTDKLEALPSTVKDIVQQIKKPQKDKTTVLDFFIVLYRKLIEIFKLDVTKEDIEKNVRVLLETTKTSIKGYLSSPAIKIAVARMVATAAGYPLLSC